MISLANGHPSPDACDVDGLREASRRAALDIGTWRYGPSAGDPELRERLASLSGVAPEAVIITSGSQQGIDLVVRAALDPGDRVGVPAAVYPATLSVLAANGMHAHPVAEDRDGPLPSALARVIDEHALRALYLTPTYGNPTGRIVTRERRRELLDLCTRTNVLVVEDDPYRELWFEAPPPESLSAMAETDPGDASDRAPVVTLHSCSKTIAPGLRVGWMVVPPALRAAVAAVKQMTDLQAGGLAQRTVAHYLDMDRLDGWLGRVRALYAGRHAALTTALNGAGLDAAPVEGGMFVWARLPEDVDGAVLFDHAVALDVLYTPGAGFAADPDDGDVARHVRLCFATGDAADMDEAGARLCRAVERSRGTASQRPPGHGGPDRSSGSVT